MTHGSLQPARRSTDGLGRRYELAASGRVRNEDGLNPLITAVRRYRPDGTLEVETRYDPRCRPIEIYYYDATGERRNRLVWVRHEGIEGAPYVRNYTFTGDDGYYYQYQINVHNVAYLMWRGRLDQRQLFTIRELAAGGNTGADLT